jgi:hypothetical protein
MAQRREQERVARRKERRLRRHERRERRDEEFRLREQLGLSPPAMSKDSSLEEEEEEEDDGGCALPERWEPTPPTGSRRGGERAGVWGGRHSRGGVGRGGALAEASGGAVVATLVAPTAPAEPSRKRKRGFSTLR